MKGDFVIRRTNSKFSAFGVHMTLPLIENNKVTHDVLQPSLVVKIISLGGNWHSMRFFSYYDMHSLIFQGSLKRIMICKNTIISLETYVKQCIIAVDRILEYIEQIRNSYSANNRRKLHNLMLNNVTATLMLLQRKSCPHQAVVRTLILPSNKRIFIFAPLSVTIHKQYVSIFSTYLILSHLSRPAEATVRLLASTQKLMNIAKEKGLRLKYIIKYELIPTICLTLHVKL